MLSESEMVIYPHNKHFDKLFELLRIRKSWKPKNTPCHGQINDIDETEELDQDNASRFRSGVGVLLYLSHDLIECQFCVRCLARYMSKPTQRSMDILKHLVCYLLGRVEYGLLLSLHELDRTSEGITLFVYSDSDWAGHRGTEVWVQLLHSGGWCDTTCCSSYSRASCTFFSGGRDIRLC